MNKLKVKYENNEKVAHAVYKVIKEREKFCLRPFNRFRPAYTEWWIIPSKEWPAYKFGKLCFHRRPRSLEGSLYAGYYVEKGLGQNLQGIQVVPSSHVMKDDWHWHKFVKWAQRGEIDAIAQEVCKAIQVPVHILVEAYAFNRLPHPDVESSGANDTAEFALNYPGVEWKLIQPGRKELQIVNKVTNIASLVNFIIGATDLDFYWIDLVVGARFRYGKSEEEGLDGETLWERVLRPWEPLLLP
ncbi:MAG: hypothetical protein QXP01_00860 [Candidatus Hadarchaeum sp.]